jgi:hypothetical protein
MHTKGDCLSGWGHGVEPESLKVTSSQGRESPASQATGLSGVPHFPLMLLSLWAEAGADLLGWAWSCWGGGRGGGGSEGMDIFVREPSAPPLGICSGGIMVRQVQTQGFCCGLQTSKSNTHEIQTLSSSKSQDAEGAEANWSGFAAVAFPACDQATYWPEPMISAW